jgi:hypothetical protein
MLHLVYYLHLFSCKYTHFSIIVIYFMSVVAGPVYSKPLLQFQGSTLSHVSGGQHLRQQHTQ